MRAENSGSPKQRIREGNAPYHQDGAPYHSSMKTMAKIDKLHFELLLHSLYSPDLASSEIYLKKTPPGNRVWIK